MHRFRHHRVEPGAVQVVAGVRTNVAARCARPPRAAFQWRRACLSRSVLAVDSAPVLDVKDQRDKPLIIDFVEDAPVSRPYAPGAGVAHKLRCLPRPGILRKTIDDPLQPPLHSAV